MLTFSIGHKSSFLHTKAIETNKTKFISFTIKIIDCNFKKAFVHLAIYTFAGFIQYRRQRISTNYDCLVRFINNELFPMEFNCLTKCLHIMAKSNRLQSLIKNVQFY